MDKPLARLLATLGPLIILALLTFQAASAQAALLYGGEQPDSLGSFAAKLHYHSFSSAEAELTVVLTNLGESGSGFITGLALNNPGGRIESISPAPDFPDGFLVLGADSPHRAVPAEIHGMFDFGAALDGDFSGAGDPTLALGTDFGSETRSFRFYLHGTDLHLLDDHFFLTAASHDAAKPGVFAVRMAGLGREGDETALAVADTWLYR